MAPYPQTLFVFKIIGCQPCSWQGCRAKDISLTLYPALFLFYSKNIMIKMVAPAIRVSRVVAVGCSCGVGAFFTESKDLAKRTDDLAYATSEYEKDLK